MWPALSSVAKAAKPPHQSLDVKRESGKADEPQRTELPTSETVGVLCIADVNFVAADIRMPRPHLRGKVILSARPDKPV